ncbi:leucoanthocyanidin reductase-like [Syzygium oleosum]|uniref:leucoanthocyanidin reductase-like n=1 Tax=Syzygium oleosum TaxID=219896 RepID=UPI0011D273BB|nr:leucoanthocyanidin reductase-like [Syzygium oleosum]
MGSEIPRVEESGRTLIIGSSGFIGRFVAEASLASGWPTYLLVRGGRVSSCKAKANAIMSLQDKGAIILQGSSNDKATMEKILKEHRIEIVISAVGGESILEQLVLVEAMKSVGTIKRYVPSEFGHDIDRADPVEPGLAMYEKKRKVRRLIEGSGVPYTYICCNSIAAWPYHDNTHPADVLPPLDRFHIYGDGTVKAYFVAGSDIGKFTIKCLDDDRTLNKTVHFQPPTNLLSINELASLWEEKIGLKLPRVTVTEDDLLFAAQEMVIPRSVVAALTHDIFIKGCQVNYSLDKPTDVEVTSLYPDMTFKTVDECFGDFAKKIVDVPKTVEDSGYKVGIMKPKSKPEALVLTA